MKLGRLAGQYAKPRSSDLETRDGVTLPAYRGDAVNGFDFTAESRVPDPQRLVEVYHSSAVDAEPRARLRHRRLRRPAPGAHLEHRLRALARRSAAATRSSASEIDRALTFMQAIGADPDEFHRVDFHSSHEALILEYEHALTRIDSPHRAAVRRVRATSSGSASAPASSTAPTSSCSRHIRNPIGVKLGPDHEPGRRDRAGRQAQPATTSRAG